MIAFAREFTRKVAFISPSVNFMASLKSSKRYVIRKGKKVWIFDSWGEVQALVSGFPDAKYKSFPSLVSAEKALEEGWEKYYQKTTPGFIASDIPYFSTAIAVDAAHSSATGVMEYQGISLATQQQIFYFKSPVGTNNIWEFLAIVHGLQWLKKEKKSDYVIYSDSKIAIKWIQLKTCKTNLIFAYENKELFALIQEAEEWLKGQTVDTQILRRDTSKWGENPADFGRK